LNLLSILCDRVRLTTEMKILFVGNGVGGFALPLAPWRVSFTRAIWSGSARMMLTRSNFIGLTSLNTKRVQQIKYHTIDTFLAYSLIICRLEVDAQDCSRQIRL
jgi:hypothetical protein